MKSREPREASREALHLDGILTADLRLGKQIAVRRSLRTDAFARTDSIKLPQRSIHGDVVSRAANNVSRLDIASCHIAIRFGNFDSFAPFRAERDWPFVCPRHDEHTQFSADFSSPFVAQKQIPNRDHPRIFFRATKFFEHAFQHFQHQNVRRSDFRRQFVRNKCGNCLSLSHLHAYFPSLSCHTAAPEAYTNTFLD